jgi:amino acid transporter
MYVLNEVKNPVHTVKIAGPLGLLICGVLYLLANVAYFAVATPQELATSGITVASYFMGKVFGAAAKRAWRYESCCQSRVRLKMLTRFEAFSSRFLPWAT